MSRSRSVVLAAAVAGLAVLPAVVRAQGASLPIEIGTDAALETTLGQSQNTTVLSLPASQIRIGFYASPRVSIEPMGGLTYYSGGGGSSSTDYYATLGVLFHFNAAPTGSGPYLRPFVGISGFTGTGSEHQANVGVGLGTGTRVADRLGARFEVNYTRHLASGDYEAGNALGASAGLSYFLH